MVGETRPSEQPPGSEAAGTPSVADGWSQWMGKPQNRAALIQFGIAMMQPLGLGETGLSHAANAVGAGGEAAANVERQDLARQREGSQEELRSAQANLAGERANAQGAFATARQTAADAAMERALRTGERNDLLAQNRELQNVNRIFSMQRQANAEYQKEVGSNILWDERTQGKKPTFTEWLAMNPHMDWRTVPTGATAGGSASAPTGTPAGPAPGARPGMSADDAFAAIREGLKSGRVTEADIAKKYGNRPDYAIIRQKLGL